MANVKKKYYVVLKGHVPGIYDIWEEAKKQVDGFPGPVFKGFESKMEAEKAWKTKTFPSLQPKSTKSMAIKKAKPTGAFLVVDAACSGSPGPTEYQGFYFPEKVPIFHKKLPLANNNIGEFLAIVHAQAWMAKEGYRLPVYSDSITAISWVKKKKVKSELARNLKTIEAWELVDRALLWLNQNQLVGPILKWETEIWGENPADFGRK